MFFLERWILKNSFLRVLAKFLGIKGQIIEIEGGDLWCDFFGDKNNPAMVLLMGGGCQGIIWTESFCENLAKTGLYVIRFDQKDTGLSSYSSGPYTLLDMGKDVISLLDRLHIKKSHMMGISMGGAIAQIIAAHFPSYVHSLILLATTNNFYPVAGAIRGDLKTTYSLSSPKPDWFRWIEEVEKIPVYAFLRRLKKHIEGWRILNGDRTEFPEKYYRHLLVRSIKRQRSYKALLNHRKALLASLDLVQKTEGNIKVPTLIIHGECDPLFPKDHPKHVASTIPLSKLLLIKEMGHNFCPCFQSDVVKEISEFIESISN
ncbi:MAG: alpha/beta hydrolase [Verrucomicrobia bacterium]|nr:alpha/beta hydrolase [Verrucomicrobiota bacterium]